VAPVGWVDMLGLGNTVHDTNVLNAVGALQSAWQLYLLACMILTPATAAKEGMVVLIADQELPPLVE